MYVERPGLHSFLAKVFRYYDVAIWTSAGKPRTDKMMNLIFSNEERNQFKFVFTQEDGFHTRIQRPDKSDGRAC